MRSAHAAGDRAALRIAVHSTKSNARDLGALELAELCAQLEQQCKEGDSVDCDAELTTIFVKADEAIQAFKTINLDNV
jgi:HPt (histidine-containing phosphotransfer) domain-containing protein